jgi:hypothetical protein
MWKTVLFLLFTLAVVPVITYYSDVAPADLQWSIIKSTYTVCLIFAAL